MSNDPRHKNRGRGCRFSRIRLLYDRTAGEASNRRRESWTLVEADGARKVLYEAHEEGASEDAEPIKQRLMTLREALREPRSVARQIWLALED